MGKLADAGHKDKTLQRFRTLDHAVKAAQKIQDILYKRVGDVVQNRFIIFIDQNDDLFMLGQGINQINELSLSIITGKFNIMLSRTFFQKLLKTFLQCFRGIIFRLLKSR